MFQTMKKQLAVTWRSNTPHLLPEQNYCFGFSFYHYLKTCFMSHLNTLWPEDTATFLQLQKTYEKGHLGDILAQLGLVETSISFLLKEINLIEPQLHPPTLPNHFLFYYYECINTQSTDPKTTPHCFFISQHQGKISIYDSMGSETTSLPLGAALFEKMHRHLKCLSAEEPRTLAVQVISYAESH